MTRRDIIARHRNTLQGILRACFLRSSALGIRKPFYVYEPPGLKRSTDIPILFLFRGHEREWVNMDEDSSRTLSTAIEDIDKAIALKIIPPVLVVMPGLNSSNNHIPSLGINMAGAWPPSFRGLGSGKYWDFLTDELIPAISTKYPQAGSTKLAAGFSLGGYTISLLAINKPGLFEHVGIYDGLFMWPDHRDPRTTPDEADNDSVWTKGALFHPAFGIPRHRQAFKAWNPTDTLLCKNEEELKQFRQTTWWISCAPSDGQQGNRNRAEYYLQLMQCKEIPLGFKEVIFDDEASHTWHWADKFLLSFLKAALLLRSNKAS